MYNASKSAITTTRSIALVAILAASTVLSGCTANNTPTAPVETYSASGSGGALAQEHISQGAGGALRQQQFPAEGVTVPPKDGSVNFPAGGVSVPPEDGSVLFPEVGSTVSGGALEGTSVTGEVPALWQADAAM